jgi:hypothetical protein
MNNITKVHSLLAAGIALAILQAGCATRPAPDFKGRWKSVNRYAETTEAIPLHQSYVFQPAPMDGTLKNMLTRWAKDSKMSLSYLHSSDFTLHAPVEQVNTYSLEQAASQLTSIYAGQRVSVAVEGKQIIVREAGPSTAASSATGSAAAAGAGTSP